MGSQQNKNGGGGETSWEPAETPGRSRHSRMHVEVMATATTRSNLPGNSDVRNDD